MSDPAGTKFDGAMAFGSQVVTIATVAYVAEDIQITHGSKEVDQMNQFGVPSRQVLVRQKLKGSATLQLPSDVAAAPALFAAVSLVPIGGGTALNFLISEMGEEFKAGEETKVKVSLVEKLN